MSRRGAAEAAPSCGRRGRSHTRRAGLQPRRHARWVWLAAVLAFIAPLAAQMPDLRQMSGQPLPSPDLPAGTVSVRVVRGSMSNNVTGQDVELRAGDRVVQTVTTDGAGRAVFSGVQPNERYQAAMRVGDESLVSQTFSMPSSGGVRLLLVSGLSGASSTTPPAPARPGTVALGHQSRLVFELAEESVEVFVLLDLVNPLDGPVNLQSPLAFDLPDDAANATALQDSANIAKVEGQKVLVSGPLAAGTTTLQFAYRIPADTGAAAVRQVLPMPLPQGTVIVRKQGTIQIEVAGEQNRRDVTLEGRTYQVVTRGAVPAGGSIDVTLTGLPAHARWPRFVALTLAGLIVAAGLFYATARAPDPKVEREKLQSIRAQLFRELVTVERKLRGKNAGDPTLTQRREELVTEIAELDAAAETVAPAPDASSTRAAEASPAASSALQ
jgi:hypothetical protein